MGNVVYMPPEKEQTPHWIQTEQADMFFGCLILMNAMVLGVDIEVSLRSGGDSGPVLFWIQFGFTVAFTLELLLRIRAWGCGAPSQGGGLAANLAGLFDALIVGSSVTEYILIFSSGGTSPMHAMSVMRVFRLLRIARVGRLLTVFPELSLLASGLLASIQAVFWVFCLLVVLIYICSLICAMELGRTDDPELRAYFGSVGWSFWTHFMVVTLEGYPSVATAAARESWVWYLYFVAFILFSNVVLFNLVTGIVCEGIITQAQDEELASHVYAEESRKFSEVMTDILSVQLSAQGLRLDSMITFEVFVQLIQAPGVREAVNTLDICLSIDDRMLFDILDEDQSGELSVNDFIASLLRLRGSKDAPHSLIVQADLIRCSKQVRSALEEAEAGVGQYAADLCAALQGKLLQRLAQLHDRGRACGENPQDIPPGHRDQRRRHGGGPGGELCALEPARPLLRPDPVHGAAPPPGEAAEAGAGAGWAAAAPAGPDAERLAAGGAEATCAAVSPAARGADQEAERGSGNRFPVNAGASARHAAEAGGAHAGTTAVAYAAVEGAGKSGFPAETWQGMPGSAEATAAFNEGEQAVSGRHAAFSSSACGYEERENPDGSATAATVAASCYGDTGQEGDPGVVAVSIAAGFVGGVGGLEDQAGMLDTTTKAFVAPFATACDRDPQEGLSSNSAATFAVVAQGLTRSRDEEIAPSSGAALSTVAAAAIVPEASLQAEDEGMPGSDTSATPAVVAPEACSRRERSQEEMEVPTSAMAAAVTPIEADVADVAAVAASGESAGEPACNMSASILPIARLIPEGEDGVASARAIAAVAVVQAEAEQRVHTDSTGVVVAASQCEREAEGQVHSGVVSSVLEGTWDKKQGEVFASGSVSAAIVPRNGEKGEDEQLPSNLVSAALSTASGEREEEPQSNALPDQDVRYQELKDQKSEGGEPMDQEARVHSLLKLLEASSAEARVALAQLTAELTASRCRVQKLEAKLMRRKEAAVQPSQPSWNRREEDLAPAKEESAASARELRLRPRVERHRAVQAGPSAVWGSHRATAGELHRALHSWRRKQAPAPALAPGQPIQHAALVLGPLGEPEGPGAGAACSMPEAAARGLSAAAAAVAPSPAAGPAGPTCPSEGPNSPPGEATAAGRGLSPPREPAPLSGARAATEGAEAGAGAAQGLGAAAGSPAPRAARQRGEPMAHRRRLEAAYAALASPKAATSPPTGRRRGGAPRQRFLNVFHGHSPDAQSNAKAVLYESSDEEAGLS